MANKQLINEFVDQSAAEKQLGGLETQLTKIISLYKQINENPIGGGKAGSIPEATKQIDAQTKAQQAFNREQEKAAIIVTDIAKETAKLNQINKERKKVSDLNVQSVNQEIGAYDRLKAQVALADKKLRDLIVSKGEDHKATQKARAEYEQLYGKMVKTNESMGHFRDNVGNYKDATVSLRTQIRELTQTLAQMELHGKGGTKEFGDMAKKLGGLKDAVGDVQSRAKFFADDQRYITGTIQALNGLIGAYAAYSSAVGLIAGEDEELQKTMAKMMQLMVMMNGIQQVATALNKDSMAVSMARNLVEKVSILFSRQKASATVAETVATEADTMATKTNTIAKTANKGILGLLIAAIGALIVGFYKMTKESTQSAIATKQANDMWEEYLGWINKVIQSNEDARDSFSKISSAFSNLGMTGISKQADAMKELATIMELVPILMSSTSNEAKKLSPEIINIAANFNKFNKQAAGEMIIKLTNLKNNLSDYGKTNETLPPVIDKIIEAIGNESKALDELNKKNKKGSKSTDEQTKAIYNNGISLKRRLEIIDESFNEGLRWEMQMKNNTTPVILELNETIDDNSDSLEEGRKALQKFLDTAAKKYTVEQLKDSILNLTDGLDKLISIDTFGFIDSGLVNAFKTAFGEVERLIVDFKGDKFEILQAAVTSLGNVINSILQAINQNVASTADANLKKIEDNYSKQEESFKTQLDNQIISQEEYDGKIRMLNEQKDAQERRLKHKAFEDERKLALANAAIALAQAELFAYVSGMSTSNPTAPAVAIAYAALATLLGGIQIGIIAARPNPYWMGRVGGPEETATVGEKGFEYISTSTGLFKTPGSTTLTRLPAGASVIPHGLSAQLDRYLGMPSVSKITKVPDAASNSETNQLLREIKNKQTVSMNIDKNGLAVYMHRGSAWSKHINNHIMGYK